MPRSQLVGSNDSDVECAPTPSPPPPIVIAGIPRLMGRFESVLLRTS